jgi:iron complex outermembrane recepter protein
VAATFNGVDARTEYRLDQYTNKFSQMVLTLDQDLGERTKLKVLAGRSRSSNDNPVQTTVTLDRYDSQGYTYDYSGNNRLPAFNYGFDVTNPANWQFSSSVAAGDASLIRMRPNLTHNSFDNVTADLSFELNDTFTLNGGLGWKKYDFDTFEARRFSSSEAAVPLPAGTTVAQISKLFSGFGKGLSIPGATPTSWITPDLDAIASLLGINCNCVNQYGDFRLDVANSRGNNRVIEETDKSAYAQLDFTTQLFGRPLRGNLGLRYVKTSELASAFVGANYVSIGQDYTDTLPSANLTLEVQPNFLVRLAAAKVVARPRLTDLTPGGTLTTQTQTLTNGNPLLQPFRAKNLDLSFEWYPDKETLLSLGLFYKDIGSFVQTLITTKPYSDTGLPLSLLPPSQTAATPYTVTAPVNTDGGKLKGVEFSVQRPFSFLPGFWSHFGGIANYTRISSKINYVLTTSAAGSTFTQADLVNLSPTAWNLTLYWQNDKISARISEAYRDRYLSTVPGGSGNDMRDFEATYNVSKALSFVFSGVNLTDQVDDRWISSTRNSTESYDHFGRQYFIGARYKR